MTHTAGPADQGEELLSSPLLYRLLRQADGTLAMEVVVGGIAMSTVRMQLTGEEAAAYAQQGTAATDRLAQSIQANPSFFGRAIAVP